MHEADMVGVHYILQQLIMTNPELFSNKINVSAPTQGWTPLHYAIAFFHIDMIKLLIGKFGADAYNKRDKYGLSCVDYLDPKIPKSLEILDIIDEQTQKYIEHKEILEKELKKYIIGQLLPINSVSSAIRRKLNGWYDPEHSNLVFLFLGSSGVGKTELAKSLSKIKMHLYVLI